MKRRIGVRSFRSSILGCAVFACVFFVGIGSGQAATGVVVQVQLSPAGNFQAKSSTVQGFAVGTMKAVEAKNVVIPLRTLSTSIELRDKHLKDKYLEVGKYPNAELIQAKGANGKGTGRIRIRGIEKEISGRFLIKGNELEAKFPLKLSDFKIEGIRYMGVGVKDEVHVTLSLPVKAKP